MIDDHGAMAQVALTEADLERADARPVRIPDQSGSSPRETSADAVEGRMSIRTDSRMQQALSGTNT